jgi:CSLREA domain-containing protein
MKIYPLRYLLLCMLFINLFTPYTSVKAAGILVTSLSDTVADDGQCTLREAIQNANDNAATNGDCVTGNGEDTITFSLSGTITLDSTLPNITDAAGLNMDGTGQSVTISGNELVRVMINYSGSSLNLNFLTIEKGYANDSGAGIYSGGNLDITNSVFSGNNGNAIYASSGTLNISNSTFSGNSAPSGGGGIASSISLNITNSTFSANSTTTGSGGGIWISGYPDPITMNITNSTFSGNSVTYGTGGGIFANNTILTIRNSTFSGNSANELYGGGGGIFHWFSSTSIVSVGNTIFANNTGGNCLGTITNGGNNIDDGVQHPVQRAAPILCLVPFRIMVAPPRPSLCWLVLRL